ncbi:glycosyltransferase family 2 protein [Novosphingobium sp.]|uniref:glycosyltransferase family 2 protein n=1 Tax=Novosphingobium sp. TaxID=1874826 RepID=UPI00262B120F|nr:glycosyltransferase family 2 protein [Novosphingobium sp.]
MVLAHGEAACRFPAPWLTAFWWRLCGKRVRARAQFAPLLAQTRWAYAIWLRQEPDPVGEMPELAPQIVALVEPGIDQAETVTRLADQGVPCIAIGTPSCPTLADVSGLIDPEEGAWLMPIPAGDVLAVGAWAAYRAAAAQTDARIVFADDDLIDHAGTRSTPHFKPCWNPELQIHHDLLTGSCIVKVTRQDLCDLPRENWAAQLIGRVIKATPGAVHIPHILHHRRSRPAPRAPAPIVGRPQDCPAVSVIIPTRNRADLLRTCIDGLVRTAYPDLEIIVVDNGSDDAATIAYLGELAARGCTVLRDPGDFNFSRMNNTAARIARGDMLLLLNNDIEMRDDTWLSAMVTQALRPEVGAVGARLLYPDGRIQHAGVIVGLGGGAGHAHRLLAPDAPGYFLRHNLPQFVSAVTAACLLVRRACYEAVGGLDERHFPVAFNDVDFCLRLNARGWQSFYEPRATLIHHESVSRGFDRDPVGAARLARELAALQGRWHTDAFDLRVDPYHHPALSRFSEHFVLQL